MVFRFFGWGICLLVWGSLIGCANIVPPTGGAKDETPPKLVGIQPADSLKNTRPKEIVLSFDEYVELREAHAQIQVSPRISLPLTTRQKGKKVTLSLPDSLLTDQTTYRISFGTSIRDLHEGNSMVPYTYTFSTGDYFDSLELRGRVVDAATGLDDTTASILLFPAGVPDSVITRTKPLYTSRVRGGRFEIKGLPAKPFQVFALRDGNDNLIYDGAAEYIGFADTLQFPRLIDSTGMVLYLFHEPQEGPRDTVAEGNLGNAGKRSSAGSSRRQRESEDFSYQLGVDTSDRQKRTQEIIEPISLRFNQAPDTLYADKIRLYRDSSGVMLTEDLSIHTDSLGGVQYWISTAWRPDQVYVLGFQPGFAVGEKEEKASAGRYVFRTKRASDYGIIQLSLPGEYSGSRYLIQLNRQGDSVDLVRDHDSLIRWTNLKPGDYQILLMEDENGNGQWDPGQFSQRRQPERVYPYRQPLDLKPGWELQVDFLNPKDPDRPRSGE